MISAFATDRVCAIEGSLDSDVDNYPGGFTLLGKQTIDARVMVEG